MHRSIALVAVAMILAGCSAAAAPSTAPATIPSSEIPDSLPPATPVPTPSTTDLVCTAADFEATGLDPAMTLAGTPFRFQWQTLSPRDGSPGGWSDSVPGPTGRFVSGEAPVVVGPVGAVARLEPASTVTFRAAWMELYELDADDRIVDPDGPPVERADLRVVGGDLEVLMPADAGHWLLNIYGRWMTDCAEGDGYVDLLLITS
jgi:hypothetical protein